MKILYIVSTLKNSGPVNQLFNVLKFINDHKLIILTLSPEVEDSRIQDFRDIGVEVSSLSLDRVKGLLYGKKETLNFIKNVRPDLIHTQGIRPDSILFRLKEFSPIWVSTIHNYPKEDYPMKFGMFKGHLMALQHLKYQRGCMHNIACSNHISNMLIKHNVNSNPIQNGTDIIKSHISRDPLKIEGEIKFVTVGSLIPRKNMMELVRTFNLFLSDLDSNSSLTILGDGPEMEALQAEATANRIIFKGNVNNVNDVLAGSNFFISASQSEGLPNTVLEAMSNGLPCILSKIPSHLEFSSQESSCIKYFDLAFGQVNEQLLKLLKDSSTYENYIEDSNQVKCIHNSMFSSNVMSDYYLKFYLNI